MLRIYNTAQDLDTRCNMSLHPERGTITKTDTRTTPKILNLETATLGKLIRPWYGICDFGDYWLTTFKTHMTEDLKLSPIPSNKAVFVLNTAACSGVSGTLVDDVISCRDQIFCNLTERTNMQFEAKDKVFPHFEFRQVTIEKTEYGNVAHRNTYAETLMELSLNSTFDQYRTLRHKLASLSSSRPDVWATSSMASQAMKENSTQEQVKTTNKVVKHARKQSRGD